MHTAPVPLLVSTHLLRHSLFIKTLIAVHAYDQFVTKKKHVITLLDTSTNFVELRLIYYSFCCYPAPPPPPTRNRPSGSKDTPKQRPVCKYYFLTVSPLLRLLAHTHPAGLFCTNDQLSYTGRYLHDTQQTHETNIPCPQQDSKPRPQQSSGCRPKS